jgi:hypothetical protein
MDAHAKQITLGSGKVTYSMNLYPQISIALPARNVISATTLDPCKLGISRLNSLPDSTLPRAELVYSSPQDHQKFKTILHQVYYNIISPTNTSG